MQDNKANAVEGSHEKIVGKGSEFELASVLSPATHGRDGSAGLQLAGRSSSLYNPEEAPHLGPLQADAASVTPSLEALNVQLRSYEQIRLTSTSKALDTAGSNMIVGGEANLELPQSTLPPVKKRQYQVLKVTDYDLSQPGWQNLEKQRPDNMMLKGKHTVQKKEQPLPVRIGKGKGLQRQ